MSGSAPPNLDERLVWEWHRRLRALLRSCGVQNEDDLHDLLQDTWVAVLTGWTCRTSAARVDWPWIRGICLNKLRDWHRRQRRALCFLPVQIQAATPPPPAAIQGAEQRWLLRQVLHILPLIERRILQEHFLTGKPMREVAAKLGMTQKQAEGRLRRALARLSHSPVALPMKRATGTPTRDTHKHP